MKAAVVEALHHPLRVDTVDDPTPAADEVIIQVKRCGICGSDLHMLEEEAFGICPGDILGHEFAGEVMAVGAGAQTLKTGDLVSVSPLKSCGQCDACRAGETAWCAEMQLQGGGYGEFAAVAERQCVALPNDVSMADGAIVEPLAVALHGVNQSGIRAGDRVLILGAGPIGLATAFWARRRGAAQVVIQDIQIHQQARALEMGATHFIGPTDTPVDTARQMLGGFADVVFECVGLPGLITQASECVKTKGKVVILGLCTKPDTLIPFDILSREICLQTSAFFTQQEYCASLDALAAGAAEPRHLITDTIALDAVPVVFEALKKRTHQCKVLIAHDK